jgi:dipeptidase E
MKLVLTSAGVNNDSIKRAISQLAMRTPSRTKVGFIPTAANAEEGSKDWYIKQFTDLQAHGYNWIDVIDPSADGIDWKSRLSAVDVIFVSGGNTFHLLNQFRITGIGKWLGGLLKHSDKVYVGASAGTIVATPSIEIASIPPGDPNIPNLENLRGMNWVNFEIEPHCDARRFKTIEFYAQSRRNSVYAIDDETAIVVDGNIVRIVSEGTWKKYN